MLSTGCGIAKSKCIFMHVCIFTDSGGRSDVTKFVMLIRLKT